MFANHLFDKGLIPRNYEDLQFNNNKTTDQKVDKGSE